MRRLLFITATLIVLFSLAGIASRLIGKSRPSILSALFTDANGADCKPDCLLGLHPGMSYKAAVALLRRYPLLAILPDKPQVFSSLDSGLFSARGKGILAGMQLGIYLQHNHDQLTGISIADQAFQQNPAHWLSFSEAIPSLGSELYVAVNSVSWHIFYFRDTRITVEADFDFPQLRRLRNGLDVPVNVIEVGFNGLRNSGKKWCGIKFCHYGN